MSSILREDQYFDNEADFCVVWNEDSKAEIEQLFLDHRISYFVKESSYYDQHTATYHSRVVALCPVLHRSNGYIDFNSPSMSADVQKSPLFWVKMEDIESYLSQNMVMTSNYNNAATMSMADFFDTNKYKGDIYMTTNMQGKSLAQMVNEAQAAAAMSSSEGEGNNSSSLGEDSGEGNLDQGLRGAYMVHTC